MINFEDLIRIFYIWVPNTTIKDTMDKIQLKQHSATIFRRLTKKKVDGFSVLEHFFPYPWPWVLPTWEKALSVNIGESSMSDFTSSKECKLYVNSVKIEVGMNRYNIV